MMYPPSTRCLNLGIWFLGSVGYAHAQNCWRDTPCSSVRSAAFSGEWDSNVFAPASRIVSPSTVFSFGSEEELGSWPTQFTLDESLTSVYIDFGLEVGGIVTIDYEVSSLSDGGSIGLAFTEAKNWIGPVSDSSSGLYSRTDGAIYANFSSAGEHTYSMPDENLRGGFRYLTLFLAGDAASVTIHNISLELSFQPTWSDLRAYQGYFHSNDDLLNKIWYSGAYTLQLCALHPSTGRAWPAPAQAWSNTADIGPGDTINTDGAKRDRTVWPGDMGVAVPAAFYSTGDLESVKNALQVVYNGQTSSGLFPFSGPPLSASGSDTYHMWSLIGTYNYALYSGDIAFVRDNWSGYVKGVEFLSTQFNTSADLIDITTYPNDWGRFNSSHILASAQMLAYHTFNTGATLADWVGDETGLKADWLDAAARLQEAVLDNLWDEGFGAFKDNLWPYDNGIHPQDGNALAVFFGVVNASSDQAQSISSSLTDNWTPIGAESPELPGEVSPFISSFEIQSHLIAGQAQRALDLIRTSWGWYLNNANGTQSTMIEGYLLDGSFGYRHDAGYEEVYSYTSHAHGWATGPVTALTQYILGLSVTGQAGSTWQLAPQFGDLTEVQGGFTTSLGKFSASWTVNDNGSYVVSYDVPANSTGELILPYPNKGNVQMAMDGQQLSLPDLVEGSGGRQLYVISGEGGTHRVEINY
ncbi:alpha-L-rhamnosidase B [Biscogniauxia mediterranea]|nr:alpha-L-rhamnosidase B [Biscogniauxia mediterranea]